MSNASEPVADRCRILLVDDNSNGLVARKAVLEELGLIVTTATNGAEALELFRSDNFEVLVTDFKMPQMNGDELIRCARALKPQLKVILLSGFVEPLGLTEQSTGADEVITKSAGEVGMLVRSIARLLNRPARKPPGSSRFPPRSNRKLPS
jgi:CheY-like chemotaxis protein